jgi:hypothetical protein
MPRRSDITNAQRSWTWCFSKRGETPRGISEKMRKAPQTVENDLQVSFELHGRCMVL